MEAILQEEELTLLLMEAIQQDMPAIPWTSEDDLLCMEAILPLFMEVNQLLITMGMLEKEQQSLLEQEATRAQTSFSQLHTAKG